MIVEKPDRCEATSEARNRCTRAATEVYETPGDALHLCKMHFETLRRKRSQIKDDEHYVRRWRASL